ncbi:hydroxymethylglutaryl-CoA lyase [Aquamicrobium terrae]|uniref:Hydroxymethylglutaryl-CoA lyase n=1 Tax=Aquamicrobium terrae TaxID=1324945 RepID=A0ABV2N7C2_9HYPH
MSDLPNRISIKEEGPREGFQIESAAIPTERKVALIDALSGTGLRKIQIVSFVNPRRVPGMADADDVVRTFRKAEGVDYYALWLNLQGFERALVHRARLAVRGTLQTCASEAFLRRNQNRNLAQNEAYQRHVADAYRNAGVPVDRGSVMAAFGCNFEGDIAPATVLRMVDLIFAVAAENAFQIDEIALADTMGWATPRSIKRVVGAVRDRYPDARINLHLHDTRGMGIANAYAGLEMGVDSFDASVAGLGGCPFAAHPGASGNVCTEDLVFMCEEMGIETGVDLGALIEAAHLARDIVGHSLPGHLMQGGKLSALRQARKAVAGG